MEFLQPSRKMARILNPDAFISWQKASFFAYAHLYKHYNKQVADQCNFATMWGLYRLKEHGLPGFFCYGEYKCENHSWIEHDGLYYDLTLIQFESRAPKLAVVKPSADFTIIEKYDLKDIPLSLDKYDQGKWLGKAFGKYVRQYQENGFVGDGKEFRIVTTFPATKIK